MGDVKLLCLVIPPLYQPQRPLLPGINFSKGNNVLVHVDFKVVDRVDDLIMP